jgi:hypothetical protein
MIRVEVAGDLRAPIVGYACGHSEIAPYLGVTTGRPFLRKKTRRA